MPSNRSIAQGLFDWVNSLKIAEEIHGVEDVADGSIIWKVLQHIDPEYFPDPLPDGLDSADWESKWNKLRNIYPKLIQFLKDECQQTLPLPGGPPDLREIAHSKSIQHTNKLLKLVFVAAIKCSNRNEFLSTVQDLQGPTLEVLMLIAKESGPPEETELEESHELDQGTETYHVSKLYTGNVGRPGLAIGSELAFEERVGAVIAQNEKIIQEKSELQKKLDDTNGRLAELQTSHDTLQGQLNDTQDRLTTLLAGSTLPGTTKSSDSKHEAIIATLETRIVSIEDEAEVLRRSNELLRIKSEKTQKLQDEYDEMKLENSKLARRANTADKYRQKLEASLSFEKENQDLKTKVSQLQKQLKDSDSNQVSTLHMQRQIEEYESVLSVVEKDRNQLKIMQDTIQREYEILEARWHETEAQSVRYQASIEELKSRLQDYEEDHTPTVAKSIAEGDAILSELDDSFEEEAKLTKELAAIDLDDQNYISEAELREIMSAMQAQVRDATSSGNASSIESDKKLASKIERNRNTIQQLIQHSKKQSALIAILRSQVPSTPASGVLFPEPETSSPKAPAPPPISQNLLDDVHERLEEATRLNQNLRREIRLMASAWHDQNRRQFGGNPFLLRATPSVEPRSFLGKQRKIADEVLIGKRMS